MTFDCRMWRILNFSPVAPVRMKAHCENARRKKKKECV